MVPTCGEEIEIQQVEKQVLTRPVGRRWAVGVALFGPARPSTSSG